MTRLTDDQLQSLLAGCEGVTPEWATGWAVDRLSHEDNPFWRFKSTGPEIGAARRGTEFYDECGKRMFRDSYYIGQLDPETVSSLITELMELRKTLEHERDAGEKIAIGVEIELDETRQQTIEDCALIVRSKRGPGALLGDDVTAFVDGIELAVRALNPKAPK